MVSVWNKIKAWVLNFIAQCECNCSINSEVGSCRNSLQTETVKMLSRYQTTCYQPTNKQIKTLPSTTTTKQSNKNARFTSEQREVGGQVLQGRSGIPFQGSTEQVGFSVLTLMCTFPLAHLTFKGCIFSNLGLTSPRFSHFSPSLCPWCTNVQ